jgi:hypothetical protein
MGSPPGFVNLIPDECVSLKDDGAHFRCARISSIHDPCEEGRR